MSTQIAVRLPDEIVHELDRLVASGGGRSRADVVTRALKRELRRAVAEAELDRLPSGDDEDLAALADWAGDLPVAR